MNRRQMMWSFVCMALFTLTGCPWSSIEATIKQWIPTALLALGIIFSLVPGLQPLLPLVVIIKAGLADVLSDIDQYTKAPAADKMGWIAKISEVLTIVEGNINQFWTDVAVPAGAPPVVQMMIELILSAISGFIGQLTPPPQAAVLTKETKRLAARAKGLNYMPMKISLGDFKNRFNQLATQANYKGNLL